MISRDLQRGSKNPKRFPEIYGRPWRSTKDLQALTAVTPDLSRSPEIQSAFGKMARKLWRCRADLRRSMPNLQDLCRILEICENLGRSKASAQDLRRQPEIHSGSRRTVKKIRRYRANLRGSVANPEDPGPPPGICGDVSTSGAIARNRQTSREMSYRPPGICGEAWRCRTKSRDLRPPVQETSSQIQGSAATSGDLQRIPEISGSRSQHERHRRHPLEA